MKRFGFIFRAIGLVAIVALLAGCSNGEQSWLAPPTTAPSARILFVGNSYTFYNGGLKRVLTEIAAQRGKAIVCLASTSPGVSLEWHWNSGDARYFISHSNADWVVLQDYSLQPTEKRALMDDYIHRFEGLIKPTGAKTALYMTWCRQNRPQDQQTITEAYETNGRSIGAAVVPCGVAWQHVHQQRPNLVLYRSDNSHPTAEGTYLNACCFYVTLLGGDPRGLPPLLIDEENLPPRRLSEDVTHFLQQIAWETAPHGAAIAK